MREVHELKIYPEYFRAVRAGKMRCVGHRHDRQFKVGDILDLREFVPESGCCTENQCLVVVTHMMIGGSEHKAQFGIAEGYVVMSIRLLLHE